MHTDDHERVPATPPDEPQVNADGSWSMWAIPEKDAFVEPGDRRHSVHFSHTVAPVPVLVRENPDGPYWGWLRRDEQVPTLIYPHLSALRVCFGGGLSEMENPKNGRVLRLSVVAA